MQVKSKMKVVETLDSVDINLTVAEAEELHDILGHIGSPCAGLGVVSRLYDQLKHTGLKVSGLSQRKPRVIFTNMPFLKEVKE